MKKQKWIVKWTREKSKVLLHSVKGYSNIQDCGSHLEALQFVRQQTHGKAEGFFKYVLIRQ
jgi:hypothetical protein